MSQTLTGIDNIDNELVGDVLTMTGDAKGGNDILIGGNYDGNNFMFNELVGDAITMSGSTRGGNDTLIGGNNTTTGPADLENDLVGDAFTMLDSAHGGNVTLIGGNNTGAGLTDNELLGDATTMRGSAQGGNNTLIGGNNSGSGLVGGFQAIVFNDLFGDAQVMSDSTQGGNNTLIGGNNSGGSGGGGSELFNLLVGAAVVMSGSAHAGNNTLTAGTATAGSIVLNNMWGNAQFIDNIPINGSNDIPGSSNVTLGHDTFIFKDTATQTVGTQNSIHDFIQSQHDLIEFAGVAGVKSFANLSFDTTTTPGSTIIHAGADAVTLVGFTGTLTAHDFVFA
jgi:hypothetical protein